jgi:predicted phosphodiesterase
MNIAVFSDLHANLAATKAVLEDCRPRGIGEFWCLGDIVGYGLQPGEVLAIVREICSRVVMGNHDHYLGADQAARKRFYAEAAAALEFARKEITAADLDFLSCLPITETLKLAGRTVGLAHGSYAQASFWEFATAEVSDANDELAGAKNCSIILVGHSHIPSVNGSENIPNYDEWFTLEPKKQYLINVGSIGRSNNNDTVSRYVELSVEGQEIRATFHAVSYHIERTAEKTRAAKSCP